MADIGGWVSVIASAAAMTALAGCGDSSPADEAPAPRPSQNKAVATQSSVSPSAAAASKEREVSELTGFISPSGNVSCMIDTDYVRCDIIDRDWSPPPRPADCEFDYGQGISLAPGERAQFVCAGDTAFGAEEVLPYGETIRAGAMRCESAEAGVTCRDDDSGRGFFLSRESYQLF